jgi:hypothetical protein
MRCHFSASVSRGAFGFVTDPMRGIAAELDKRKVSTASEGGRWHLQLVQQLAITGRPAFYLLANPRDEGYTPEGQGFPGTKTGGKIDLYDAYTFGTDHQTSKPSSLLLLRTETRAA